MDKNYYITTPIYYPSAKPHMGHAYSSIIADFFARFKRMDGFDVHFLTGTDEHGLKIQRAAENMNIEPLEFCDQISQTFRDLSKILNLSNTDFIRTTEDRHKKSVQYLWSELEKNDDIYLSKYSGWYSVSDEAFYNEDEIIDKDGKLGINHLALLLSGLKKSLIFLDYQNGKINFWTIMKKIQNLFHQNQEKMKLLVLLKVD